MYLYPTKRGLHQRVGDQACIPVSWLLQIIWGLMSRILAPEHVNSSGAFCPEVWVPVSQRLPSYLVFWYGFEIALWHLQFIWALWLDTTFRTPIYGEPSSLSLPPFLVFFYPTFILGARSEFEGTAIPLRGHVHSYGPPLKHIPQMQKPNLPHSVMGTYISIMPIINVDLKIF